MKLLEQGERRPPAFSLHHINKLFQLSVETQSSAEKYLKPRKRTVAVGQINSSSVPRLNIIPRRIIHIFCSSAPLMVLNRSFRNIHYPLK